MLATATEVAPDLDSNISSFRYFLQASNHSPKSIINYMEDMRRFRRYLVETGMPQVVAHISREHIRAFIAYLLNERGLAPSTVRKNLTVLKIFFKFLCAEGEIREPLATDGLTVIVPEDDGVAVLSDEQLTALMRTCEKDDSFNGRRDTAILRLFFDTGLRLHELGNITYHPTDYTLSDIDVEQGVVTVLGKGRRHRTVSLSSKTRRALDRYLKRRRQSALAEQPWLWIGKKGQMTGSGIYQMVKRRAEEAGIGRIHPHMFRHTFVDSWLERNGGENALMQVVGWRSRKMVDRCAKSRAGARALEAQRALNLGDRI